MEEKDLINILENLNVPEMENLAHQSQLRARLLQEHAQIQTVKESFSVFSLITNSFTMKRFSYAMVLVLLAIAGVFVFTQSQNFGSEKQIAKQPVENKNSQNQNQPEKQTPQLAQNDNWKEVQWHDPANTVLGYKFDIPNSWFEVPTTTERYILVNSCKPNAIDCDNVELAVSAVSATQTNGFVNNLTSGSVAKEGGYTVSATKVGGISATMLNNPRYGNDKYIYLQKDGEWFVFHLLPGLKNFEENYALLDKILATFAFTAREASQAPAEYNFLKDIDSWEVAYQIKSNKIEAFTCADGRNGSTSNGYLFSMGSQGYGEAPGDINTPYAKVVTALQKKGWIKCSIPESQQDPTGGTYNVYIKDNRLIKVAKSYSMGTGNYLGVLIQYGN